MANEGGEWIMRGCSISGGCAFCTDRSGSGEGCLSLDGLRKCTRYKNITVEYLDMDLEQQKQDFSGFIAQNIQHQCDHCQGIVV